MLKQTLKPFLNGPLYNFLIVVVVVVVFSSVAYRQPFVSEERS